MKFVKSLVLRSSSEKSVLLETTAGFRYSHAARACLPRPTYWEADPWMRSCRPFSVAGSSVLNSWSRSTALVVFSVPMTPLLGISGLVTGPSRRST
jgi:hypothetical protein